MKIFITGSTDGLGRYAAEELLADGHDVIVHARSAARASAVADLLEDGAHLVIGDLADRDEVRRMADEVNGHAPLDTVIHNAGVLNGPALVPVNIVAPYLLTALVTRPQRQIYVTSGLHEGGSPSLEGIDWSGRSASAGYSTTKLLVTALTMAVARLRPDVVSSAVDPGWVPTKMGGPAASDDLRLGHLTQEWLATSDDPAALVSGGYWFHQNTRNPHPAVHDVAFQDALLAALEAETGVALASPPR